MMVLLLDQFAKLAGGQRCLLDVAAGLRRAGWSLQAALPEPGPLHASLRGEGAMVHAITCGPYGNGRISAADMFRFAADLTRLGGRISGLLGDLRPSLLYVNGPRLLPAAALAAHGRVPMVFHCHSRLSQRYASMLVRASLRHAGATVVACCRFAAEPLAVAAERLHVVYNGVPGCAHEARRHAHGQPWRIGMIGRIAPVKGQVEFLEAARMLSATRVPCEFVICGGPVLGTRAYYERVRALAQGMPVELMDWQDDVTGVLRNLDLVVVASTAADATPRIIPEAYAAGVPVVAYRTGGIPEVVVHKETGWLVDERTAGALAEAVLHLIAAPELHAALVDGGARAWRRKYTVERFRAAILNVIEQAQSNFRNAGRK